MYGNFQSAYGTLAESFSTSSTSTPPPPPPLRSSFSYDRAPPTDFGGEGGGRGMYDNDKKGEFCSVRPRGDGLRPPSSSSASSSHPPLVFAIPPSAEDFSSLLLEFPLVIVKAWAPWCEPCKAASVHFRQWARQWQSLILDQKQLLLLADNIEDEHSLHREKVDVVPTFFVYHQGKLDIRHIVTGTDLEELSSIVQSCLRA